MSHTHTVISGQKSWHDPRGNHKQNPHGFPPTLQHLVKSSEGQVINEETEVQIWISPSPMQFITHLLYAKPEILTRLRYDAHNADGDMGQERERGNELC